MPPLGRHRNPRKAAPDERAAHEPSSKSTMSKASRNPLIVTIVGFFCTGVLGGLLTWYLNSVSETQTMQRTLRDNAIAAVSDISELANERRERATLVASAIRRGASEAEVETRKAAYDESYVYWNAKVPGDLLRFRAGLPGILWKRTPYEKYIDGLTNVNILVADANAPDVPGLFTIMDACVTEAFDAYRLNSFAPTDKATGILDQCKFTDRAEQTVTCFAMIAEDMYEVVNIRNKAIATTVDQAVVTACKPAQ
jgi:hypothetical protein